MDRSFTRVIVLHLDDRPLTASVDVAAHLLKREDLLAEVTLGEWIRTVDRLMSDELLLEDAFPTTLAHNASIVAFPKFVGPKQ